MVFLMSMNWIELLFLSAKNPRAGASQLLGLKFNNFQLLQISILSICLISIFLFLVVSTFGAVLPNALEIQPNQTNIFSTLQSIRPINIVISGIISFIARSVALTYFSRVFNGIGSLRYSILSLAWFDIIHSMGLAIVFIGLWVSPTITILFTLVGTIWLMWIAVSFISVLHNFKNVSFVFFGMIIGYLALHFCLNLIF